MDTFIDKADYIVDITVMTIGRIIKNPILAFKYFVLKQRCVRLSYKNIKMSNSVSVGSYFTFRRFTTKRLKVIVNNKEIKKGNCLYEFVIMTIMTDDRQSFVGYLKYNKYAKEQWDDYLYEIRSLLYTIKYKLPSDGGCSIH